MKYQWALGALMLVAVCPLAAQSDGPRLRLRSGPVPDNLLNRGPADAYPVQNAQRTLGIPERRHLILQFGDSPHDGIRRTLEAHGVSVLAYVPDNALLVSAPFGSAFDADLETSLTDLGLVYAGALTTENKLSPLVAKNLPDEIMGVVVDLHADVSGSDGRQIAATLGLTVLENPDLPPQSLLVQGTTRRLRMLAADDAVASVYPASPELLEGRPTAACRGGTVALGVEPGFIALAAASDLASSFGEGWDGPGLGATALTYNIGRLTPALDPTAVRAEIVRAILAWSSVVRISFAESSSARRSRQLDIFFADRVHGDNQNFDGRGGVLGHTFYPPPNTEPIAGDVHLDIEEQWLIGNDVDVFSVTLHELGHALGLGHSDDPAAVMYPFYRRATTLHEPDVLEIRKLYASTSAPVPTPPTPDPPMPNPTPTPSPSTDTQPPSLVITTPSVSTITTRTTTYNVRGRATDNVRVTSVAWVNQQGKSGSAQGLNSFATGAIPLVMGQNRIGISASDGAGNTAWRYVTVTRR